MRSDKKLHVLEGAVSEAMMLAGGSVARRNNVWKEAEETFKCTDDSRTLAGRCGVAHEDML
jgi:hypothetical protein